MPHVAMFDGLQVFSLIGFAGILELVGGTLVLLGLLTRPAAFILSGEMAFAYFMGHASKGFVLVPMLNQGELAVLKGISPEVMGLHKSGKRVLIVDDLVDTGKTARVVRDLLPDAHFATVYAKPMGRPLVDTFITEVSQDTWIYFPWDTGLAFQPPIRAGGE